MLLKASIMGDKASFNAMLPEKDPAVWKELGRRVAGFDDNL
jgi:predicted NAD-dependent protein-ADP-ribosyltransferase YbiA (DUF1768 family)